MEPFEHDLRRRLLVRTRGDVGCLREALSRDDRGEVRRLAHRLHGAAGALELTTLSELGARMERSAASGEAGGTRLLLEELEAEVQRLIEAEGLAL